MDRWQTQFQIARQEDGTESRRKDKSIIKINAKYSGPFMEKSKVLCGVVQFLYGTPFWSLTRHIPAKRVGLYGRITDDLRC